MIELISGKEALIALVNGNEIEFFNIGLGRWFLVETYKNYTLSDFMDDKFKFRLKPKTTTINGIKVPSPFDPKEGDDVWCVSDDHGCGYCAYTWSKNHSVVIGAWRTEEEIKQVVAALRSIFKGE